MRPLDKETATCWKCFDMGIGIAASQSESVNTLMRCFCRAGRENTAKLPIFDGTWAEQLPFLSLFPVHKEWFRPVPGVDSIAAWRARVQIAEWFWADADDKKTWGPVWDRKPKQHWQEREV